LRFQPSISHRSPISPLNRAKIIRSPNFATTYPQFAQAMLRESGSPCHISRGGIRDAFVNVSGRFVTGR
jgi:hypothetical protein